MKKTRYYVIVGAMSLLAFAAIKYSTDEASVSIAIDLCDTRPAVVSAHAIITAGGLADHATLYLELFQSNGENIYSIFGPLSLAGSEELAFDVPEDVCSQTSSMRVSLEYDLSGSEHSSVVTQDMLISNTTVRALPAGILVFPVSLFSIEWNGFFREGEIFIILLIADMGVLITGTLFNLSYGAIGSFILFPLGGGAVAAGGRDDPR